MLKVISDFLLGVLSWAVGAGVIYLGIEVVFKLGANPLLGFMICFMLASRLGLAIYYKDINGRMNAVNNINYFVWLAGLSIFAGLLTLTDIYMPYRYEWAAIPIDFFIFIGTCWLMVLWRENALEWLIYGGYRSNIHELELIKDELEAKKMFRKIDLDLKSKANTKPDIR